MKHAIVFPGQGWQYPKMGYDLYKSEKVYKDIIDYADSLVEFNLKEECFSDSIISDTKYVQPIVFATCYALYRLFEEKHDLLTVPIYFAGHSLGEYTALTVAGALKFEDALALVEKRGKYMSMIECEHGKMGAVIGINKNRIEEICKECTDQNNYICISNYNSQYQYVIAGTVVAFNKACEKIKNQKGKIKQLNVSSAFHTKMMSSAAERFSDELDRCRILVPKVPVISNVTGEAYKSIEEIRELLKIQITKPVQWIQTMQTMEHKGVNHIFEVSLRPVLSSFFKQSISGINTLQFNGKNKYCIMQSNKLKIYNYIKKILVTNKSYNIRTQEYDRKVISFYKELDNDTATDYPIELIYQKTIMALQSKGCCDSDISHRFKLEIVDNLETVKEVNT